MVLTSTVSTPSDFTPGLSPESIPGKPHQELLPAIVRIVFQPRCRVGFGRMETQGGVARQESDANALQPFALDCRTECGWTVIDVRGDLDVYTSPTLRHLILDCINRGDSRIIVD